MGNEVGGSWEEDNNTNAPWKPHDPWTYAMRFTNYYAKMKAVDPTNKIGAVADLTEDGTANYTNHPVVNPRTGVTHNGWTPVMLTYMRSNNVLPDFLIHHKYAPDVGDKEDLLWSKTWADDAASLRQMLTDYLGSAGTNITLECTEHGGGGDRQSVSLVGGLFYADSAGQVLQTEFNSRLKWDFRNGRGGILNSDPALYGWRTGWFYNEPVGSNTLQYYGDGGMVHTEGSVTDRYPIFYTSKLLTRFAAGGDQVVTAATDYPLLSTYAVKRTNGSLSLLVINKSSYASLNAAIALSGYVPSPQATVYSYGIPQDEAARTNAPALAQDIATSSLSAVGPTFGYSFPPYSATVLSLSPARARPIVSADFAAEGLLLTFPTELGPAYTVEYKDDLADVSWQVLGAWTGTGLPLTVTNTSATNVTGFYRVRVQ